MLLCGRSCETSHFSNSLSYQIIPSGLSKREIRGVQPPYLPAKNRARASTACLD